MKRILNAIGFVIAAVGLLGAVGVVMGLVGLYVRALFGWF